MRWIVQILYRVILVGFGNCDWEFKIVRQKYQKISREFLVGDMVGGGVGGRLGIWFEWGWSFRVYYLEF